MSLPKLGFIDIDVDMLAEALHLQSVGLRIEDIDFVRGANVVRVYVSGDALPDYCTDILPTPRVEYRITAELVPQPDDVPRVVSNVMKEIFAKGGHGLRAAVKMSDEKDIPEQ